ncbi:MAG: hypothetical protein A3K46_05605 [Chloroflexi bacterium RBG_13_60_9]|nr:MAG: hypothetical protein A3K46_05605 [Chloroflexi bacterium RBG_13_60_9]
MTLAHTRRIIIGILFLLLCLLLSGCGSFPVYSLSPLTSASQIIYSGGQGSFDCDDQEIFVISTGNYKAEFIGQSGDRRIEMMTVLLITVQGRPESYRSIHAYTGLIYYFYQYRIRVLRLGIDILNEYVEINMSYVRPSSTEYIDC